MTNPAPADDQVTYVVGLPVVVTIAADGTVTFAVCLEDASSAVSDEDGTAEHVAAVEDAATADARVTVG